MKIGLKCGCGAAAEWEDTRGLREHAYGKYIIVAQSEEWMKIHTSCKLDEDEKPDTHAMGFIQE